MKDAGSTPRKAGAKAIVRAGGAAMVSTIGGGLLEHEARRVALRAMETGHAEVFDFRFDGKSAREGDPVCGGTVRVLVDPAAKDHRAAYAAAAEARRSRLPGCLVTQASGISTKATAGEVHVSVRWVSGAGADAEKSDTNASSNDTLVEPLIPPPLLLIVGGGHVGQALARQAVLVGFDVVVVEDRPEFAEAGRFPGALAVRCGDVAGELRKFPLDGDTFVALVSRGHRTDAAALAACVREPGLAYVGMMGSRRKVALLRKEFIETRMATAAQFDRVHAPIGLDIGAETPAEIAASIVAEMIAVLRKREARPADPAARRKVASR
jgi:xanthine dehydrogenase accessory factor